MSNHNVGIVGYGWAATAHIAAIAAVVGLAFLALFREKTQSR